MPKKTKKPTGKTMTEEAIAARLTTKFEITPTVASEIVDVLSTLGVLRCRRRRHHRLHHSRRRLAAAAAEAFAWERMSEEVLAWAMEAAGLARLRREAWS